MLVLAFLVFWGMKKIREKKERAAANVVVDTKKPAPECPR